MTEILSNFSTSSPVRHKKTILIVILFFGVLVLLSRFFLKPAMITVVGKGTLSVTPAIVEMTVSRVDSNLNPISAINQGENSTRILIDESKRMLLNPEIQRAFYQVNPTVAGNDKFYQVANVFKLTSYEPAKTSELIKSLYTQGATIISGVSFLPAGQEDVTQEARRLAIKDASEQAKKIAKAAGKRVGRIVSITDDLNEAAGTISSGQIGDNEFLVTNFLAQAPDKIEVSKVVSVTYEIW